MAESIHNDQHDHIRRTVSFQRMSPQMILILLLLLSACGAQDNTDTVAEPTSTPQPPVLTLIFPADEAGEADTAAIAGEIRRRSGLTVDVRLVETHHAVDAACTTPEDGIPAAVWLDGLSYAAASAQGCGVPVLQVGRVPVDDDAEADVDETAASEAGADATEEADEAAASDADESATEVEIVATDEAGTDDTAVTATDEPSREIPANVFTGLPGVIVANSSENITDLAAISDSTFCRPAITDLYGWLLPMLIFQAEGVDLSESGIAVVDLLDPSTESVIEAVAAGECVLAGLPDSAAVDLPDNIEIVRTSPAVPFSVLVMPVEIDAGARDAVIDALLAMADDAETGGLLRPSLQQAILVEVTEADFEEFSTFIASTGLSFAAIDQ